MILEGHRTYQVVGLGAMFLAIITTPMVIRLAKQHGILDAPGVRKVHARAVARVGGVAIVFAAMAMVTPVLFLDNRIGEAFRESQAQVVALLAGGLAMFLIGLLDDLRGVRAQHKFLVQFAAALTLCIAGGRIGEVALGPLGVAHTREWGWLLTLVWIVGVTNAVNLIDGLDGLAAGICLIAAGVVGVFAVFSGQIVLAVVMLALIGSLAGFLFLNFNPARVFMGDCGSLFLGFMIAGSSVICVANSRSLRGLAIPALALGVPIFDTLFSMLRRLIQRRSIFSPDKGHIHHRLLARGFEHHQVALLIYIITSVTAGLGLLMIPTETAVAAAIFVSGCVLLVVVFRVIGAVRIRETVRGMQRNREIADEFRRQRERYEHAELLLRNAGTFDQWWEAVCQAAGQLDFASIRMTVTSRDGSERRMVHPPSADPSGGENWVSVSVPIRDRRAGAPLRAEISIVPNGSVESAGRRVGFFGRLIDLYSLADMTAEDAAAGDGSPETW